MNKILTNKDLSKELIRAILIEARINTVSNMSGNSQIYEEKTSYKKIFRIELENTYAIIRYIKGLISKDDKEEEADYYEEFTQNKQIILTQEFYDALTKLITEHNSNIRISLKENKYEYIERTLSFNRELLDNNKCSFEKYIKVLKHNNYKVPKRTTAYKKAKQCKQMYSDLINRYNYRVQLLRKTIPEKYGNLEFIKENTLKNIKILEDDNE